MLGQDSGIFFEKINHSADFFRISSGLVSADGLSYKEFKERLKPRFFKAKIDIFLSYFYFFLSGLLIVKLSSLVNPIFALLIGSILFGFFIAHNQLYLHAAAHFNLAKKRSHNDIISNLFIGVISGEEISAYRKNHSLHHKFHGTVEDTENSYFNALSLRFIFDLLTMVHAWKILRRRSGAAQASPGSARMKSLRQKLFSVLFHSVLFFFLYEINFALAASWFLGLVVFFPFFGALRQILEHRDEFAEKKVDYRLVAHGPVNRIFKTTPFSCIFGGAGFLRHAIHHWDPSINYTNLPELESYLKNTSLTGSIRNHTTTYTKTFLNLFG